MKKTPELIDASDGLSYIPHQSSIQSFHMKNVESILLWLALALNDEHRVVLSPGDGIHVIYVEPLIDGIWESSLKYHIKVKVEGRRHYVVLPKSMLKQKYQ